MPAAHDIDELLACEDATRGGGADAKWSASCPRLRLGEGRKAGDRLEDDGVSVAGRRRYHTSLR